jgi:hypothetical protein
LINFPVVAVLTAAAAVGMDAIEGVATLSTSALAKTIAIPVFRCNIVGVPLCLEASRTSSIG